MNKKIILALLILAVIAVILVFNSMGTDREIEVDLVVGQITAIKSLAFLAFISTGVLIGILLK